MTERTRNSNYRFGTFELQTNERRLLAAGEPVVVGPRAFDLLVALVERRGELVTKEDLPNVLSKIRGLRVASRTSAFSFKGSRVDIPAMAQKRGVANVLEGSVRKAGNRVRITVELVEVATDSPCGRRPMTRI